MAEITEEQTGASGSPSAEPSGPSRRPLSGSAIMLGALVVVVGGLLAWAAASAFGTSRPKAWDLPLSGPYYVAAAKAVVPATTPTAHGATAATTKASMFTTTPKTDVTLKVNAPPLGGTYGSDGQLHDAFSPAYFDVPAGQTVHVTVESYDTAWHTFTSPTLGINEFITPSPTGTKPVATTFTFTAPSAGNYFWLCALPCDPYSMGSGGYMEGIIHAVRT